MVLLLPGFSSCKAFVCLLGKFLLIWTTMVSNFLSCADNLVSVGPAVLRGCGALAFVACNLGPCRLAHGSGLPSRVGSLARLDFGPTSKGPVCSVLSGSKRMSSG